MKDDFTQMMTPFDLSVSSPSIQTLKFLIPFLPPKTQRMLAIYIKFMEFQNTLHSFSGIHTSCGDPFEELKKMLPVSALETYDNMMNMMSMMQAMNEMDEMADIFGKMQNEGESE